MAFSMVRFASLDTSAIPRKTVAQERARSDGLISCEHDDDAASQNSGPVSEAPVQRLSRAKGSRRAADSQNFSILLWGLATASASARAPTSVIMFD